MKLAVIAHNIRSIYNIGSIFRTCDGFGVDHLYLSGYSPYPTLTHDERLPHIRDRITNQIHKTALGAEQSVQFSCAADVKNLIAQLKQAGYMIIALEQSARSILLPDFAPTTDKIALLLGEEVHGIEANLLGECDQALEIPMVGKKESFNVSVATGIALYGIMHSNAK